MNIILLGPPASGKGTYSEFLKQKYKLKHISMGDLLRKHVAEKGKYALQAENSIKNGLILHEDIATEILKDYIFTLNDIDGILLDGFPRGIISAELLKEFLDINLVIVLELDLESIKTRVANRLRCPKCGRVFSRLLYAGSTCCDCGIELKVREDDTLEVLNHRMKEYSEKTIPVINYYDGLGLVRKIDASLESEKIFDIITQTINEMEK